MTLTRMGFLRLGTLIIVGSLTGQKQRKRRRAWLLRFVSTIMPIIIFTPFSWAEEVNYGKYFCFVEKTVGIERNSNGEIKAGEFRPAPEKFFFEIHRAQNIAPKEVCEAASSLPKWFMCDAVDEIKIDDTLLRSNDGHHFFNINSWSSHFYFRSKTASYVHFKVAFAFEGYYIEEGKCTLIK